jgi:hypothetical protein
MKPTRSSIIDGFARCGRRARGPPSDVDAGDELSVLLPDRPGKGLARSMRSGNVAQGPNSSTLCLFSG